ncbi:MAG: hypothetical protein WD048_07955 [Chitinophagales bacterium]
MNKHDYNIVPFEKKHLHKLAKLMKILWGKMEQEEIVQLLEWRYLQTPIQHIPHSFVLVKNDEVLAFRGWFILKLTHCDQIFYTASLADAVVHPSERRKGWFEKMTKFSLGQIQKCKSVPFTTAISSNEKSIPGYLKIGYRVLFEINESYNIRPFSFLFTQKVHFNKDKEIYTNNVLITEVPQLQIMEFLFEERIKNNRGALQVKWDSGYLDWRFKRPDSKYVFSYLCNEDATIGFLIFKSWGNDRYSLVEFVADTSQDFYKILNAFVKVMKPKIISCWEHALKKQNINNRFFDGFYSIPKCFNFKKKSTSHPLLYMPNSNIENLSKSSESDLSDPRIWQINELYSDSI